MIDIEEHKWGDEDIETCEYYPDEDLIALGVNIGRCIFPLDITRSDAIAIAKHFGILKLQPSED